VNESETDVLRDHLLHSQEELKQLKGEWVWLVGVVHKCFTEKLIEMTSLHDTEKQVAEQNNDELLSVRQQLQLKEQECAGLQQQLQQKEEGLNQQLLKKEEELANLQQELQQKREGLSEIQSLLNQKSTAFGQLEQQLTTAQEEIVRLKEDNNSKEVSSLTFSCH